MSFTIVAEAFFGVQTFGRASFFVILLKRRVLEQDSIWRIPFSLGDSFPVGGLVSKGLVEDFVHKRDKFVRGDGARWVMFPLVIN